MTEKSTDVPEVVSAFLDHHGRTIHDDILAELVSSHGLSFDDANYFIDLLESNAVLLLGFDVWRSERGLYAYGSCWSPGNRDFSDYNSARIALTKKHLGSGDRVVFTVRRADESPN